MANSKLLKDAIADAKAVRETAIANAKIALEEAFTPRLQSILSQKLQTELDEDDVNEEDEVNEDEDVNEEYGAEDAPTGTSSSIGKGKNGTESGTDGKQPSGDATQAHTDLDPETGKISDKVGTEDDNVTVVKEGEGEDENGDGVIDDPTGASVTEDEDSEAEEAEEEDELDLESIIKELEAEINEDESEDEESEAESDDEEAEDETVDESEDDGEEAEVDVTSSDDSEAEEDDDIDLDEILREMGYGEEEEDEESEEEVEESIEDVQGQIAEKEEQLAEAYKVIKSLKGTINEVNLLNAKLLFSNKLFRNYELTNEQKMKVVETLDRTANVREVKLVFTTLAESLKYSNVSRKRVSKIAESFVSDVVSSTAPKKEIITESDDIARRFKELANITTKK